MLLQYSGLRGLSLDESTLFRKGCARSDQDRGKSNNGKTTIEHEKPGNPESCHALCRDLGNTNRGTVRLDANRIESPRRAQRIDAINIRFDSAQSRDYVHE